MAEPSLQAFRQPQSAEGNSRYTLADLMRERYASAGQGLGALAESLPEAGPATATSRLREFHEWVTRNMLEPAQYALLMPPRALARYMDPPGMDSWYSRNPMPGAPAATRQDWDVLAESLKGITQAAPSYVPGQRQSDQVEDRRWNSSRSIWEF